MMWLLYLLYNASQIMSYIHCIPYGMVKFYLTNKQKYMEKYCEFRLLYGTCRETAHRIRRVFAVMQPP